MERDELQKVAADLNAIKKLMILSLVQKGFQQKDIASALSIDEAIVSKMFPKGLLKKAKGRAANE